MIERDVKDAVKKKLKELGAYQHWPVQTGYGEPCLDCHGCLRGVYFAVETKRPGEKPTALQNVTISQILAAGGLVFVIDHPEKVSVLDRLESYAASAGPVHGSHPRLVE